MKRIIILFIFLVLIGCTEEFVESGDVEESEVEVTDSEIPVKYQDPSYCEVSSDCIQRYETTNCGTVAVNKYQPVSEFQHEYAPKGINAARGHAVCIPWRLYSLDCTNNKCERNINCSDCSGIKEYMNKTGCLNEYVSATVRGSCTSLAKCNC